MGFNWDDLWNQGTAQIEKGFEDVVRIGAPAIQSAAEQWAINVLTDQNKETQKELNNVVQDFVNQPSNPTGLGNALQQTAKDVAYNQYGLWIVGGCLALLLVGGMLRGK